MGQLAMLYGLVSDAIWVSQRCYMGQLSYLYRSVSMTNRMDDNKGKNALSFVLIVTKQSHQLRRQYKKESLLCFQAPSSDSFTPVNCIGEKLFFPSTHCFSQKLCIFATAFRKECKTYCSILSQSPHEKRRANFHYWDCNPNGRSFPIFGSGLW